jgi:oligopeptide transport system substrate-binding protein
LYRQAERLFIDQDMAIAPIYYYSYVRLYKPWVSPVISPIGGDNIAEWRIDWAAKLAASP